MNLARSLIFLFFFHVHGWSSVTKGKTGSCVSKCRIIRPRSPDAALTSRGRGEANWYKASFKLYRFIFSKEKIADIPRAGLRTNGYFDVSTVPCASSPCRKHRNNINWNNEANSNGLRQSSATIFYVFPGIAVRFCRFRHFSSLCISHSNALRDSSDFVFSEKISRFTRNRYTHIPNQYWSFTSIVYSFDLILNFIEKEKEREKERNSSTILSDPSDTRTTASHCVTWEILIEWQLI